MWRRDPSYQRLVEDSWGGGDGVHTLVELQSSLGALQLSVQDWEISVFGKVKKELYHLRTQLEAERRRSVHSGPSSWERRLMARLAELLSREEMMEKQRSRVTWLKDDDRNTDFFSSSVARKGKTIQDHGIACA